MLRKLARLGFVNFRILLDVEYLLMGLWLIDVIQSITIPHCYSKVNNLEKNKVQNLLYPFLVVLATSINQMDDTYKSVLSSYTLFPCVLRVCVLIAATHQSKRLRILLVLTVKKNCDSIGCFGYDCLESNTACICC